MYETESTPANGDLAEVTDGAVYEAPPTYNRPHVKAGKPVGLPAIQWRIPDTVIDGADFTHLKVRAVSLRGDDHRYSGSIRQDSMGLWTVGEPETALLACVADGVGSERNSHRGSALACRLLRDEVGEVLERLTGLEHEADLPAITAAVVDRVAVRMREDAENLGEDPRTFSTTLVAALISLTPSEKGIRCVTFGVGDSASYVLRDGRLGGALVDESGASEIASFATRALPGHVSTVQHGVMWLAEEDVVVICTDGLVNPLCDPGVKKQIIQWWDGPAPDLLEFAWQLSFRAKSYGDDRTAVAVWRR